MQIYSRIVHQSYSPFDMRLNTYTLIYQPEDINKIEEMSVLLNFFVK